MARNPDSERSYNTDIGDCPVCSKAVMDFHYHRRTEPEKSVLRFLPCMCLTTDYLIKDGLFVAGSNNGVVLIDNPQLHQDKPCVGYNDKYVPKK